jgi:hypothetical protein
VVSSGVRERMIVRVALVVSLRLAALSALSVRLAVALLFLALAVVRLVLADLLLAVVAIDNLALLLVYDILVVLVDTLHMLLDMVSDISHDHMVVHNLLLDSVLTMLNGVAVLDFDIDILAVTVSLH